MSFGRRFDLPSETSTAIADESSIEWYRLECSDEKGGVGINEQTKSSSPAS